ncbi:MAG: hypothetical protein GF409_02580 [Candidatus Omnitrophica bacterium]|nr:hypothetical protein [Candidatus Omnitrophota bacterium]
MNAGIAGFLFLGLFFAATCAAQTDSEIDHAVKEVDRPVREQVQEELMEIEHRKRGPGASYTASGTGLIEYDATTGALRPMPSGRAD